MSIKDVASLGTIHLADDAVITFKFGPAKCPLPRIGSKEWGWESHYGQGNKPWWSSPHNEYQVNWINGRWGVMEDGDVANRDARCRASCDDLDVAFRIAELLARRDWRKEQGKK